MDDLELPQTVTPADLAGRAGRSAGLGFLVLVGVLGLVAWRRFRR